MYFKAVLALPKTAPSAQTCKSITFIWIVWSTLYIYLWEDSKSQMYFMYLLPIEVGTLVRIKSPRKWIGFKDKSILLFFYLMSNDYWNRTEGMTIDDYLCTYALSDIKNHQRPVFICNFAILLWNFHCQFDLKLKIFLTLVQLR
mgnify:CR=1 FL=1